MTMRNPHSSPPFSLDEALLQASDLVQSDSSISAVRVFYPRRPTYSELRNARERAEERDLDVRLDASGEVRVRRAVHEPIEQTLPPLVPPSRHRRFHPSAWNLGFSDLTEGTR